MWFGPKGVLPELRIVVSTPRVLRIVYDEADVTIEANCELPAPKHRCRDRRYRNAAELVYKEIHHLGADSLSLVSRRDVDCFQDAVLALDVPRDPSNSVAVQFVDAVFLHCGTGTD